MADVSHKNIGSERDGSKYWFSSQPGTCKKVPGQEIQIATNGDNTALEVTGDPKVRYVSCFILNSLCFWFAQCQQIKAKQKTKNILSVFISKI